MKTPRRILASVIILAAAASLASCGRVLDFERITRGNGLHERGAFQDAIAVYLEVREPGFLSTVDYDLANSYARLGEYEASAELYERARRSGDATLRAEAYFNEGVALYEKSRYEESWRAFREALELYLAGSSALDEGFAEDARQNLELAWRSWKKRSQVPPNTAASASRKEGGSSEEELRLLRRLETGRWKPGVPSPPADERGDY